jgi:hypothetical protein
MKTDRYTKVILTLATLGLWGMLLKPVFEPTAAFAQKTTLGKRHSVLVINKEGNFATRESGTIALNATGLMGH